MVETIEIQADYNNNEFWPNATKYSSWSKGEYKFLKELSFILVTLRNSK